MTTKTRSGTSIAATLFLAVLLVGGIGLYGRINGSRLPDDAPRQVAFLSLWLPSPLPPDGVHIVASIGGRAVYDKPLHTKAPWTSGLHEAKKGETVEMQIHVRAQHDKLNVICSIVVSKLEVDKQVKEGAKPGDILICKGVVV